MRTTPERPRSTLLAVLLLWFAFYGSIALFTPALFDDADSVHAEVAREMLVRHDYVTLYANSIRYLEKAPLFYWSMAACMKLFSLLGETSPTALVVAARIPLGLTVLALALLCEAFARKLFDSEYAGLYAALIILTSSGIFIFTRILIPDATVCLWLTLALYAFWRESTKRDTAVISTEAQRSGETPVFRSWLHKRKWPLVFASACALNVLTKGLIGAVFPVAIVTLYLLLTSGLRQTLQRLRMLFPLSAIVLFFAIAAPWHILAGLANPTQGHPAAFHFVNGHWQVPLPTDGNVRGWFWFYFMNEHLLRYLNLRVPHDYDTAPLWLFWGLCLAWLLPWSTFALRALWGLLWQTLHLAWMRVRPSRVATHVDVCGPGLPAFLLFIWAAFILLFFSLSTRQEYYVLPALPALAILVGGWLASEAHARITPMAQTRFSDKRVADICIAVWLAIGALYACASAWLLFHMQTPTQGTDLSSLLSQNPADYALSMGHFLDLNARALGLFRPSLIISAVSLFGGPLAALILRKRVRPHAANLVLASGTFIFLIAVFLALRTFAPVLSSAQLAEKIALQIHADDLIVIHGEYEAGSTLGFYLQRNNIHILEGRSSNLWYGSFFPDSPKIFETPQSIAAKWSGTQRIFMWQSTTDEPRTLPSVSGPVYVIATSGGKEIVSNRQSGN